MMEDLILSCKEHRLLQKFQKRLQNRYDVEIQMPDTFTSAEPDVIFVSIMGEKRNRECVKKFLSEKMKSNSERDASKANVLLITLCDSEEEETTVSESKENSTCVLEENNCARHKFVNKSPVCNTLDNSVCVLEPPERFAESNKLVKKTENINRRKLKLKKFLSKKMKSNSERDESEADESKSLIILSDNEEEETGPESKENSYILKKHNCARLLPKFVNKSPVCNPLDNSVCVIEPPESCAESNKLVKKTENRRKRKRKKCSVKETKKRKKDDVVLYETPSAIRPLRPVVIDGSNVAITHGVSRCFSAKGIKLAVEYFLNLGHTQVTAFVPDFRKFSNTNHRFTTKNPKILKNLAKKQHVVFTPSRRLNGKIVACYDDRFIVQLASTNGGVIVSNDKFRDLVNECDAFKETIENRRLPYVFVGDLFMIPRDPAINHFLSFPPDGKT